MAHVVDPQFERVPRHHRALEARTVDSHKIINRLVVSLAPQAFKTQNAGRLCEALDDHDAWHHRITREMAHEERLIDRHVLDGDDVLARLARDHAIHHQERIAVRQVLEYLVYVHAVHDLSLSL